MSGYAVEHNTRKMIVSHIIAYPGVSFGTIKKMLDLPESTLRYHLNHLEKKKEIRSSLEGNNRCYYPVQKIIFDLKSESGIQTHELNDTQDKLLDAIQRYPGITQKELILRTGLKRITVWYHIKKLIDFRVVRQEPNGRNISYYFISETELRKKIRKRLIAKLLNNEIDEKTFLALKRKLE